MLIRSACVLAVLAGLTLAATAQADPTEDLAKARNCFACHSVDNKIVGPAYKDVAAKFKGRKDAVAYLSGRIRAGSVGDWGQIPMPANSVTEAEAKQLAQWVLSRK